MAVSFGYDNTLAVRLFSAGTGLSQKGLGGNVREGYF